MARILGAYSAIVDGQRGHLFPWAPVFLALGIGGYFILPVEPDRTQWGALAAALPFVNCNGLRYGGAPPERAVFGRGMRGGILSFARLTSRCATLR